MSEKHTPLIKPDIVAIIENEGITLKRRGRDYWAPCPFHQEKTPSFKVSTDKQAFYCFGCGQGGDVVTFIMLHRNVSFKDALAYLHLGADEGRSRHADTIEQRKRRLIETFRNWERDYYHKLCKDRLLCVHMTRDLMTMEEVEERSSLIHMLPIIEYHLDILWHGSDEDKFALWREYKNEF